MPQPIDLREAAMDEWSTHRNRPYIWGGNTALEGFDCSGLVIEGLKSVGLLPREGDWTAHALLHDVFQHKPRVHQPISLRRGMLVFWANPSGKIRHVEVIWALYGDTILTLGASGGGSKTTTLADAQAHDARVKVRPLVGNWVAAIDPFPR